jgi:hypothetical protein
VADEREIAGFENSIKPAFPGGRSPGSRKWHQFRPQGWEILTGISNHAE